MIWDKYMTEARLSGNPTQVLVSKDREPNRRTSEHASTARLTGVLSLAASDGLYPEAMVGHTPDRVSRHKTDSYSIVA
jgi:hypothetical protein